MLKPTVDRVSTGSETCCMMGTFFLYLPKGQGEVKMLPRVFVEFSKYRLPKFGARIQHQNCHFMLPLVPSVCQPMMTPQKIFGGDSQWRSCA